MNRYLPLSLALACAPAFAGEPLLVPDFTPGSTSEFALAFMLQETAIEQLRNEGHIVLTSEVARPVVGDQLDACDDVDWCPQTSLLQLPARVGLVVRVERGSDGNLVAGVKFYEEGEQSPMDTWDFPIVPGSERRFALELASRTEDLLSLLGPSPADNLVAAVKLVEAAKNPAPEPVTEPTPDPEPVTPATPPANTPPGPPPKPEIDYASAPLAELLEGTDYSPRHLKGAEAAFRKAEMDVRDWMFKGMPHAGRLIVEVRGGLGIGDVSRGADVRVDLDAEGGKAAEWFQEGPQTGQALRAGVYVGYAPIAWLDVGVLGGLQYGQKYLTTGWTQEGEGGRSSARQGVNAVQFYVQPRLRAYLAPTGPVKPFVLAGGEARIFDSFKIVDPEDFTYPEPPGGIVPGATGGAGILIDPGPIVGFFVEGTYTHHFGVRADAAQKGPSPPTRPVVPRGDGYTLGVAGGVQFRI